MKDEGAEEIMFRSAAVFQDWDHSQQVSDVLVHDDAAAASNIVARTKPHAGYFRTMWMLHSSKMKVKQGLGYV